MFEVSAALYIRAQNIRKEYSVKTSDYNLDKIFTFTSTILKYLYDKNSKLMKINIFFAPHTATTHPQIQTSNNFFSSARIYAITMLTASRQEYILFERKNLSSEANITTTTKRLITCILRLIEVYCVSSFIRIRTTVSFRN